MIAMQSNRIIFAFVAVCLSGAVLAQAPGQALGPGSNGARYATDAYPGFDSEEENVKPERKEPKWFSFINGPKCETAAEQYAYCQELVEGGNYSKAAKELDALVREWPTAPEAWKSQLQYADLLLNKLDDAEEAFSAYRYLLDFYSLQCEYGEVADTLYKVAGVLQIEGKEIMFIRFANTVDVRRAYEMCILRAPGAAWVPDAFLTVAALREEEGKLTEAVQVYENLRNLYPETDQAKTAISREAALRMKILREREYNSARCQDTIDYMKLALRTCRPSDAAAIQEYLDEAGLRIEDEAYRGAKFYDSRTRTRRSAITAYEKFLEKYPQNEHADEIRERLEALKGSDK